MWDVVTEIWHRATTVQPVPPSTSQVALCAVVACVLVVLPSTWHWVRLGVTAVHEAGHAVVAVLVGRRLTGVRLHSDTSGLTVSRGKPRGPGMFATLLAGYTAPGLVGLGAALLLDAGYEVGLLWLLVALMAVLLLWIRNAFGFVIVGTGVVVAAAISWYGGHQLQAASAYLFVWLLLIAAPRPVVELALAGRARSRNSDPDQLAHLTHLPAGVWILVLLLVEVAALAIGASALLPGLSSGLGIL